MERKSCPEIKIYAGEIKAWTRDLADGRKAQTICGRRLLAYALLDNGRGAFFSDRCAAGEVYEVLEAEIEREAHGKPYFREYPDLHFNISHTGGYAACAVSTVPCGLDIQEVRPIRTKRLLERVLSEAERQKVEEAQNPEQEFCRYWAKKESVLKYTGEGITISMKELPEPAWHEVFEMQGHISGCISAGEVCRVSYEEVLAEKFFARFKE